MLAQRTGGFRFPHWLALSLVLHSGLILPFMLFRLDTTARLKRSRLQIELFGMIADRQTEAKVQRHAPPRLQPLRQQTKSLLSPDAYGSVATESPVRVKSTEDKRKPDEKTDQALQPMQATAAPSTGGSPDASSAGNADVQQRQQTIRSAGNLQTERSIYGAKLAKQVRKHLAYPPEMRKSGVEATSRIAFIVTKSGDIKRDSLRILRGSGYAAMDANALKAVRSCAPFEKPPYDDFKFAFDVTFNINMLRSRVN